MSYYGDYSYVDISDLIGRTVEDIEGMETGNGDAVYIRCTDGTEYRMMHHQDCCEHVYLEDVCGDVDDLIGHQIFLAEESSNSGSKDYDSFTWTFYRFATDRGYVLLRWYGSSNGYYGEGVSFEKKEGSGPSENVEVDQKDSNWPEGWR